MRGKELVITRRVWAMGKMKKGRMVAAEKPSDDDVGRVREGSTEAENCVKGGRTTGDAGVGFFVISIRSGRIPGNRKHLQEYSQAVVALKKAAHLLKYGRRGKPMFCPFRLSAVSFVKRVLTINHQNLAFRFLLGDWGVIEGSMSHLKGSHCFLIADRSRQQSGRNHISKHQTSESMSAISRHTQQSSTSDVSVESS